MIEFHSYVILDTRTSCACMVEVCLSLLMIVRLLCSSLSLIVKPLPHV